MNIKASDLANMYIMLKGLKPFNRWKLPPLEDIKFQVTDDVDALGTYVYDDNYHVITISRAKNGHFQTVIRTLAHEVIHLLRGKTPKYALHDAYFLAKSRQVADEFGFDPLEL